VVRNVLPLFAAGGDTTMTYQRRIDHEHETTWRVPDDVWQRIYPILLADCPPRKGPGRKPADWRRVLNGIVFRLRTGCHWNKLPPEFGDDSTIHRWYQRWNKNGVMARVLGELGINDAMLPNQFAAVRPSREMRDTGREAPDPVCEASAEGDTCYFERDDPGAVTVRP
jgi:hypothetical protein